MANLNGFNYGPGQTDLFAIAIIWWHFTGHWTSLATVEMEIKGL